MPALLPVNPASSNLSPLAKPPPPTQLIKNLLAYTVDKILLWTTLPSLPEIELFFTYYMVDQTFLAY